MPDPYDDPRLPQGNRLKFEYVGDRVRGVVTSVEVVAYPGNTTLNYQLAEVITQQMGRQERRDRAEVSAGAANLVGQLMSKRPRSGDLLDITLTETRPNPGRSDTKIYSVDVTYAQAQSAPQPPPQPQYPPQPQATQYPPEQSPGYPPPVNTPPAEPFPATPATTAPVRTEDDLFANG